jgi:ectoine hydroxylase-related dioxygenase (phytanoyl-CoA dioxygenase family)
MFDSWKRFFPGSKSTQPEVAVGGQRSADGLRYSPEQHEEFLKCMDEQGYVIMPDCIDRELLSRINQRADRILRRTKMLGKSRILGKMVRGVVAGAEADGVGSLVTNLPGKGSDFWELATQPDILHFVRAHIGEDCLLSSASLMGSLPGVPEQPLHADDALYGVGECFRRPVESPLTVVAGITLTDLTETNGATVLVPGSHRWPVGPLDVAGGESAPDMKERNQRAFDWAKENKTTEPIKAITSAGSVVLWTGSTWHGRGPNTQAEGEERLMLILLYIRGVLRSQESYLALNSPRKIGRMPTELQRLMGYSMSDTNLGHIEGQDPALLLGRRGKALLKENFKRINRRVEQL